MSAFQSEESKRVVAREETPRGVLVSCVSAREEYVSTEQER